MITKIILCFSVTVLVSIFGLWLIFSEVQYLLQDRNIYRFVPDTDFESKLPINIDITVASICDSKYCIISKYVFDFNF